MDAKKINVFWSEAGRIIDLAAKYSQKVSLKRNLLDESSEWKVGNVLNRYYDGKMANLDKAIKNARQNFEWQVMVYNLNCRREGLAEVRKIDKLLELLSCSQRREFYKKKIAQAKKDGKIFQLQNIEAQYKNPSK